MIVILYDDDHHKAVKTKYMQYFQQQKQGIQWCSSLSILSYDDHPTANLLGLVCILKPYTFKSEFCTVERCIV